jgi:class 3 adenylate cyclase
MPDEHDGPDDPDAQPLERKLATILSADVASYSRLMGEDEEGTLRTFRGHKQVFESLVALHRGRIFNTAGDAILAEFTSAVEAVRCATDIQSALRTRNDQLPPDRQVRFRIGINLGDVIVQGQDLMGDGVNVAARIQTAAEPGGICISGSVHDQILNKLSLSFLPLGERSFKNIQQPVRTFSISEAEGGGALPSPKPAGTPSMSSGLKRAVAGAVLLLLGGAYWAHSRYEHGKTMSSPSAVETAVAPAAPASAPPSIPAPSSEATPTRAAPASSNASPAPSLPTPTPASTTMTGAAKRTSHPATTPTSSAAPAITPPPSSPSASAHPLAPASAPTATTALVPGRDGTYAGRICYAKTDLEPNRCFLTQGIIQGNKITGKWPVGAQLRNTMYLNGDVSQSGDLSIHMHSEKEDGSRAVAINLTGTVRDGVATASGSFLMIDRPVTLNWRKISGYTAASK